MALPNFYVYGGDERIRTSASTEKMSRSPNLSYIPTESLISTDYTNVPL